MKKGIPETNKILRLWIEHGRNPKMKNTDTWYIQDKEFLNGNCLLKF